MRFKKDTKLGSVSRLGYNTETGYKKSGYNSTGKSYYGHLKALTLKDGVEIANFGKEFQFNTIYEADIRESDKLTIDGIEYNVKGVSTFDGITFSRLMCILQKG